MLELIESVSPVVAMMAITLTVVAIVVAKIFFATKHEVKQVRLSNNKSPANSIPHLM
ncbi:MAG: hypothetical protein ABF267_09110 [Glaciecola sp.]|jgi:hypothetical protein